MKSTKAFIFFSILCWLPAHVQGAQDNAPVETKIKTLMMDPTSQSPVIVLETVPDKRLLPIWIDVPEARAIALELEHVKTPRPLTHDLIRNILRQLGATLRRVVITDLANNTYLAILSLTFKGQEFQIDSRPSDAIAIALRMGAPIYASTQVLAKSKSVPAPSAGTEPIQGKLGIHAQDLTQELATLLDVPLQKGILVADVIQGSAAMSAGLQRGDIITRANQKPIHSTSDFEALLRATKPPAKIELEVIKKGRSTTIVIDLPS